MKTTTVRDDRGDAGGHALELLIIAPAFLVFVLLLVAFGRTSAADSKVDAAAASAARAASQQHDASTAQQAADDQVQQAMSAAGIQCGDLRVDVDTSAFTLPPGQPGSLVVDIHCTVDLSNVSAPGIPGSVQLSGKAASPVDIYQERPQP